MVNPLDRLITIEESGNIFSFVNNVDEILQTRTHAFSQVVFNSLTESTQKSCKSSLNANTCMKLNDIVKEEEIDVEGIFNYNPILNERIGSNIFNFVFTTTDSCRWKQFIASYEPVPKASDLTPNSLSFLFLDPRSLSPQILESSRCPLTSRICDHENSSLSSLCDATGYSRLSHFFPQISYRSIEERLKAACISKQMIADQPVFTIDGFLTPREGEELRKMSLALDWSQKLITSINAARAGEMPRSTLSDKELEHLVLNPPAAMDSIHKLFASFAKQLDVEISTLPFIRNTRPFVVNHVTGHNEHSEKAGWHEDYNTEVGLSHSLSKVFSSENYPRTFVNGAVGKPWIISVLFYTTAANFNPDWGCGTVFKDRDTVTAIACRHLRIVFFPGTVTHSIQRSLIPTGVETWRLSCVWRISMRFKNLASTDRSIQMDFINLLARYSSPAS